MLSLALALIMAGSGDAECFRALRTVRKRLENEMHYGHNMAINVAIGILFLGSGAYSSQAEATNSAAEGPRTGSPGPFDISDKFTVATLMCALYPVFPKDPSDNRYHLQALRHFWLMVVRNPKDLIQQRGDPIMDSRDNQEKDEKMNQASSEVDGKENQTQSEAKKSYGVLYNLSSKTMSHVSSLASSQSSYGSLYTALVLPQTIDRLQGRGQDILAL